MNPWALVKPTDYSVVDISQVLGVNQGKQGRHPHTYTEQQQ
jgi:hypothetical protein